MTTASLPADDDAEAAPVELELVEDPELVRGLSRLRRRTSTIPTAKWLAVGGGVFMPLGLLLVIAGWYGASHTTRLFEEIPYLISGGLLGIVLTTVGAALYFGYWLTRLVDGQREMADALLALRAEMVPSDTALAEVDVEPDTFVATPTGSLYHRADCQIVAGRPTSELRTVTLPARGMSPCRLCAPPA